MSGYQILFLMAISLVAGAGSTFYVKGKIDTIAQQQAVLAQQNADNQSCNRDKQLTQGAADAIESKNHELNSRLAALLVQSPHCVSIIASHPQPVNSKVKHRPAHANAGITSTALYQFAGVCEHDRQELNGLIDFVALVWGRKL